MALEQKYKNLLKELGKNPSTMPLLQNLAHLQAFYLDKTDEAIDLLEEAIKIPNVQTKLQAQCKLELADIYLFSGEQWEATLLYSQVEKAFKNEPLGHEAKFRNAKLSFYIGEFGWAKTQLDILKAATSKLIANDAMELSLLISDNTDADSNTTALSMYSRADLLVYRNQYDTALIVLDSLEKDFPGHPIIDDVLFKKAEISMKEGHFDKAANYYSSIIKDYTFGLLGDDATFNLAKLYENQLNDKTKAQQLYQDLMTNYPGSLYVVEARKRFRALRNDPVN
jgi:TolA-binding protein